MVPLLDITRLMSRAGRVLTGVDRVELAYLDEFLTHDAAFGLARTGLGFLLLDKAGLRAFRARLGSNDWGPVDRLSRWALRLDPVQRAATSSLRASAVARCRTGGLAAMLRRCEATDYFNTGHANLESRSLAAIGRAGITRHILIHDTIPLDHPQWQRPGTPKRFRAKLDTALANADRIIANSQVTANAIQRHATGPVPATVVAPLGVTVAAPAARNPLLPEGTEGPGDYFVTVGTIEPRKNHALLLDVFDTLQAQAGGPRLVICGPRGWNNAAVFRRLDDPDCPVREMSALSDAQLARVITDSRGLLFPSFAEGYGLPPLEAAALGVPVVCGDLAIYRETLGDRAVYLDPTEAYQWTRVITELHERPPKPAPFTPPTWEAHFKTVLSVS